MNSHQSNIKLIECVTLCYSCPIKAKWIHKALLQQIRVISFFYLTYCKWWHIQTERKYIYIPIIVAILYSVQNIVRVCVCVCYDLSMSINMVQRSWHKLKKNVQQTCHKNSRSQLKNRTCDIFLSRRIRLLISRCDPAVVCHVVLIVSLYQRNNPRTKLASVFRATSHFPFDDCPITVQSEQIDSVDWWRDFPPVGPIRRRVTLIFAHNHNRVMISVLLICVIVIVKHTIFCFVKARLLDLTSLHGHGEGSLFPLTKTQDFKNNPQINTDII